MSLSDFLYTPFPRPKRNRKNILWLLLIGASCSLFILIFKPFHIENQTGEWYVDLILFSLGIVFFLSIFFMEFVIPHLLPKLFQNWYLGKAILWYAWVILFVGAIIFLYKSYLGGFREVSWMEYLFVSGRVIGIALTVSFFSLGIYTSLNKQKVSLISAKESYLIRSPHAKPLSLTLNEILYIVSDDNYVDIHLESKGVRKKLVFRSSLKNIEAQLVNPLSPIYRCHRRHLINIEHVKIKHQTSRSAKLQLIKYEDEIPVSKQHVDLIVNLLHIRPKDLPIHHSAT